MLGCCVVEHKLNLQKKGDRHKDADIVIKQPHESNTMVRIYLVLASDVSDEVRFLRLVPVVEQLVHLGR